MKKIFTLITVAFLATAASAQSTWTVDKAHSQVKFSITHLAVSDVDGKFKDLMQLLLLQNLISAMQNTRSLQKLLLLIQTMKDVTATLKALNFLMLKNSRL